MRQQQQGFFHLGQFEQHVGQFAELLERDVELGRDLCEAVAKPSIADCGLRVAELRNRHTHDAGAFDVEVDRCGVLPHRLGDGVLRRDRRGEREPRQQTRERTVKPPAQGAVFPQQVGHFANQPLQLVLEELVSALREHEPLPQPKQLHPVGTDLFLHGSLDADFADFADRERVKAFLVISTDLPKLSNKPTSMLVAFR